MSIKRIQNKNGLSYKITVSAGRTLEGRQIRHYETYVPDLGMTEKQALKEALRREAALEKLIADGYSPNARLDFYGYAEKMIAKRDLKPNTRILYNRFNDDLKDVLGYLPLDKINPPRIRSLLEWLAQDGRNHKTGDKLSSKSQRAYFGFVATVLSSACEDSIIAANPCSHIKPPRLLQKAKTILQPDEVARMLAALDNEPMKWRVYAHLLLASGARKGEIAALKWQNVDFERGQIEITANLLSDGKNGVYEGTPKTKASVRFIKLPTPTMALLKEWRQYCLQLRLLSGDQWRETGYVLVRDNGEPIHPGSISQWLIKFCKRYDLPRITAHSLRHTSASVMIASGAPVSAVSRRLGHSTITTTLNVYTHEIKEADEAAADSLADVLYPGSVRQK
jgi:integrase